MNSSGRSDASTSTDDVQGRPLCLFYFTHPFGVLSPEPPRVGVAPPHVARAFLNMEPVSPFTFWSSPSEEPYDTYESSAPESRPSFETGESGSRTMATAVGVPRPRPPARCTLEFARRDSTSSSLFSGDAWFDPSIGRRSDAFPRRLVPYNRILPPLRLPSPRDAVGELFSEEPWTQPRKTRAERFSLPPIELPVASSGSGSGQGGSCGSGRRLRRSSRRLGVRKVRRASRPADLRRLLTRLLHRALGVSCAAEHGNASPALREALHTIREAWAEPRSLRATYAWRTVSRPSASSPAPPANPSPSGANMHSPAVCAGASPDASPGLMRRRYSVPETIMRKYRLAQGKAEADPEAECSFPATGRSPASASPPGGATPRGPRHDRELMRRSALMRRLWGRTDQCRSCQRTPETRSLHGSRSELRPLSGVRPSPSYCTYRSHDRGPSSLADPVSTEVAECASRRQSANVSTVAVASSEALDSSTNEHLCRCTDTDLSFTGGSTAPEAPGSAHIHGRVSEQSAGAENDERNMVPYDQPLTVDAPPYELLEIVVSESAAPRPPDEDGRTRAPVVAAIPPKDRRSVDLDEYVSNILVESLNSLTDRLEGMSASVGGDRRINIVEKEIKVRLQNAGVNTIVHLSPTSNNPIIFGNEELCYGERQPRPSDTHLSLSIREERALSADSAEAPFGLHRDSDVNAAVLHQIQQLFRDERPAAPPPAISHIEISNVDVFLEDNAEAGRAPVDSLRLQTRQPDNDVIGGVGAGNYHGLHEDPVVPRFSACPHTDSMEVNTSSSDEADLGGSGCASLVDSLDDPNSPRSILSRRSCAGRRTELVRSAIDVLDLLPENVRDDVPRSRDKAEAFFVKIQDDECECDRNRDVRVADHMPDKIKEKLHQRHRKREMRMECARRSRAKQMKREADRQRHDDAVNARKEAQRECMAILNALIDEVIVKVTQDEYKCIRIKNRPDKLTVSKSEENVARRSWRKDTQRTDGVIPNGRSKNGSVRFETTADTDRGRTGSERHQIHGKLSLRARPALAPDDRGPRRIYQKSEIHEGNKCIEILEILEYVNGSQSSPETPTSDENHNQKTKKSRIPIPVHERTPKINNNQSVVEQTSPSEIRERDANANRLLADALLLALAETEVPPPRARADSLRFKRTFDAIPEERSSLSLESGADEPERPLRPAPAHTRSAGTSPMAPAEGPEARAPEAPRDVGRRSAGTQCERSARIESERTRRGERAGRGAQRPRQAREPPPAREDTKPAPESTGVESRETNESKLHTMSADRSASPPGGSSSSGDSADGGLLCPLAPRWLGQARSRRNAQRRRRPAPSDRPADQRDTGVGEAAAESGAGGWSVTVAGSCRAALPADVEMRLRFPHRGAATQECTCAHCSCCAAPPLPLAGGPSVSRASHPPLARAPSDTGKFTLTMKKEALDSSILASKSRKKTSELPELETYRASRSKLKSSVKTRRAYSLHCWLPENEPAPIRDRNGLSVLGCAIVPELKPRAPTMSERDLTRRDTPRHYLR